MPGGQRLALVMPPLTNVAPLLRFPLQPVFDRPAQWSVAIRAYRGRVPLARSSHCLAFVRYTRAFVFIFHRAHSPMDPIAVQQNHIYSKLKTLTLRYPNNGLLFPTRTGLAIRRFYGMGTMSSCSCFYGAIAVQFSRNGCGQKRRACRVKESAVWPRMMQGISIPRT
jgi:hypothetical protein